MEDIKLENRVSIIRNYICENINFDDFTNDVNLFDEGLTNSLFAIQLITFLEKKFGIKITMDDLDLDNFKSVNQICLFVDHKLEK